MRVVVTGNVVAPSAPVLDSVPDPRSMVIYGSLRNLSSSLARAKGWLNLPLPRSEEVTQAILGEAVDLVDPGQPIDIAGGVGRRPFFAVSAALKDVTTAMQALRQHHVLVPKADGVLLIRADDATQDEDARACELAPAYGEAPTRLVCGTGPVALSEFGPWLTRSATRVSSTADLHIELRMHPLTAAPESRRMIGTLVGSGLEWWWREPPTDGVEKLLLDGLQALVLDLSSASLDVQLDDAGALVTATLNRAGNSSALGRIAAANPERTAPPPRSFLRLPIDSDFAFFNRGIEASEVARGRDLLLDELRASANDPDLGPVLAAFQKMLSSWPAVYASGFDLDAVATAFRVRQSQPCDAEANLVATRSAIGWRLMGFQEQPTRLAAALNDLEVAWAHYRASRTEAVLFHSAAVPKSLRSRPGARHYAWEMPWPTGCTRGPPDRRPQRPLVIHIVVVPDDEQTFIGVGADETILASKLAFAIAGTGDGVGTRPDLAALTAARTGAGGFVTLSGVIGAELFTELAVHGRLTESSPTQNDRLPKSVGSPIVFSMTPGMASGPLMVNARVPWGILQETVDALAGAP